MEKCEHRIFVCLQAIEQVLGLGLFFPAPFFGDVEYGVKGWIDRPSLKKYFLVLLVPLIQTFFREGVSYQLLLLPHSVHIAEELDQRLGPDLVAFFMDEDEFSEDVCQTECMPTE